MRDPAVLLVADPLHELASPTSPAMGAAYRLGEGFSPAGAGAARAGATGESGALAVAAARAGAGQLAVRSREGGSAPAGRGLLAGRSRGGAPVRRNNRGGDGERRKNPESKPNVVLIHGFVAEGNVTFQFNFGVLVSRYNVYIPDLLFFGKSSTTDSADRSPDFQARCVAAALARLGVARCDVVGFSYGGMVAFKLAETRPDLVRSLAVSGSVVAMTDAVNRETMARLGSGSSAELLMPETLQALKALFSVSMFLRTGAPSAGTTGCTPPAR